MNRLLEWILQPDDPATAVEVVDWQAQPVWPSQVMLALVIGLVLLAILAHRSNALRAGRAWRYALGSLRCLALMVPLFILLQPRVQARYEHQSKRAFAVLLDRSASMATKGDAGQAKVSRWNAALGVVQRDSNLNAALERDFDVFRYVFSEVAEAVESFAQPNAALTPGSGGQTAIGAALAKVKGDLSSRVTAGVLLLSDGANNTGPDPGAIASALGRHGVPIHACMIGSADPPDIAVSAIPETEAGFIGDPISVRVRISQRGLRQQTVPLRLFCQDNLVEEKLVGLPGAAQQATERLEVVPTDPGRHSYRVEAEPQEGEIVTTNNVAMFDIDVVADPIRVLYVERLPRWQYRFLKQAIARDRRTALTSILLMRDPGGRLEEERDRAAIPDDRDELRRFDVIVLGDLGPQDIADTQMAWVHDQIVEAGGGVVFIAGASHMPAAFMDTPLGELLPFEAVYGPPTPEERLRRLSVTRSGSQHPLMRLGTASEPLRIWETLPRFQWYCRVGRVKPGAVVLAEAPQEGIDPSPAPIIITQTVGRGRVLFVGTDETWRWRYKAGNRYFYGFWGHALQRLGLAHRLQRQLDVQIALPAKHIPRNLAVPVSVSVTEEAASQLVGDELVLVADAAVAGGARTFVLKPADEPLVYEGRLRLSEAGSYRLWVQGLAELGETGVTVADFDPETTQPEVNADLLSRLARQTGGQFLTLAELPGFVRSLRGEPLTYARTVEVDLWDNVAVIAVLAILLSTEWVLRKARYLP